MKTIMCLFLHVACRLVYPSAKEKSIDRSHSAFLQLRKRGETKRISNATYWSIDLSIIWRTRTDWICGSACQELRESTPNQSSQRRSLQGQYCVSGNPTFVHKRFCQRWVPKHNRIWDSFLAPLRWLQFCHYIVKRFTCITLKEKNTVLNKVKCVFLV